MTKRSAEMVRKRGESATCIRSQAGASELVAWEGCLSAHRVLCGGALARCGWLEASAGERRRLSRIGRGRSREHAVARPRVVCLPGCTARDTDKLTSHAPPNLSCRECAQQLARVLVRVFAAAAVAGLASAESKDCDPKKDSGCNKFIRPFYPHECWAAWHGGPNCTRFNPSASKTIKYIKHGQFFLQVTICASSHPLAPCSCSATENGGEPQYADNSNLKGYEATDIVQFGDFYTFTKFGGITTCNSPDFQRVNGILGFGLPQQMPMELPGMPSPQLPLPLLFDLTDPRVKDNAKVCRFQPPPCPRALFVPRSRGRGRDDGDA